MTPVFQTKFGRLWGNCFQACLASVLEIPIEECFDASTYGPGKQWWNPFQEWAESRGYSLLLFNVGADLVVMNCYGIACCDVRDFDERHAVVVRFWSEDDGDRLLARCEVVHDPNDRVPHVNEDPDSFILIWKMPVAVQPAVARAEVA